MRESKKLILEFDENSVEAFKALQKALKPAVGHEPTNRELFLLAMTYGYKHGAFGDQIKRSNTGLRVDFLRAEDQALMAAIQLGHDASTENIADLERRYQLAEQFAQGGILLLRESILDAVKYGHDLAAEVISLLPDVLPDLD